jgi:hypothetical protein
MVAELFLGADMTRINVIPPRLLHVKHLVVEYRELPRVFALVRAAEDKGLFPHQIKAPQTYTLGKGHVLFFYDKLEYLIFRQHLIICEMLVRGYDPQFRNPDSLRDRISSYWFNMYEPTKEARRINIERLSQKIPGFYHNRL